MIKKTILLLSLLQFNIYAIVFESNNLKNVYKYTDKNTLVIFDIDNTIANVAIGDNLIEPWLDCKAAELQKKGLKKPEAFELALYMYFTMTKNAKLIPIKNAPKIIKKLQKKGNKIIALTNRSIPVIKRTIDHLKQINISLNKNCFCSKELDINMTYAGKFSHGIIFTGHNDKGKSLFSFFEKIKYMPKKIIFVDDGMRNIISVEKECKKHNIPFTGIRFSLMDEMKKNFDMAKATKSINSVKMQLGLAPLKQDQPKLSP